MEFDVIDTIQIKDNWLIVPVKQPYRFQQLPDKPLVCEIKEKREKRSLNANNYAWQLMTEIADVLSKEYPKSKEEVYIDMLTNYGQRELELYKMTPEAYHAFQRATDNHCCIVDNCWNGAKLYYAVAILIGSSEYDTRQMSILIDGIVSEAKELGIETMTPAEIQQLKDEWEKAYQKREEKESCKTLKTP